jgi:hypothetical protein
LQLLIVSSHPCFLPQFSAPPAVAFSTSFRHELRGGMAAEIDVFAQQRGVAAFVAYRVASGRLRTASKSYQSEDPDCGWHDRQRARQDGEPMKDSVQRQITEFGV